MSVTWDNTIQDTGDRRLSTIYTYTYLMYCTVHLEDNNAVNGAWPGVAENQTTWTLRLPAWTQTWSRVPLLQVQTWSDSTYY